MKKPATARKAAKRTLSRPSTAAPSAAPVAPAPAPTLVAAPGTASPVAEHGAKEKRSKADKVIRDSFSMPRADYAMIGALKKRCVGLGLAMKKSELLRAGLAALQQLPDDRLKAIVGSVQSVKTGRPAGKKKKKRAKDELAS